MRDAIVPSMGLLLTGISLLAAEPVLLERNTAEIRIIPGFEHVPVHIGITNAGSVDLSQVSVISDLNWAVPSIDVENSELVITFAANELLTDSTATITLDNGEISEFFLSSLVEPLNTMRLVADPVRPLIYGIHFSATDLGAIISYDPYAGEMLESITVGTRATDFSFSNDKSELLVICSTSEEIHVIDLESFRLKEIISLSVYGGWGDPADTTANIETGPGAILYYVDGTWGPVLHVYDRSTQTVIQSILYSGSENLTNDRGFQDIAVTPDKQVLLAMPQYGWSAGAHTPTIASFNIAADGKLTLRETTASINNFDRNPFEAPVLVPGNGETVLMKNLATDPLDLSNFQGRFLDNVWSVSEDGLLVATSTTIINTQSEKDLLLIPNSSNYSGYAGTKAQAFTRDKYLFTYSDADQNLVTLDLREEIGGDIIMGDLHPADGATVLPPQELRWEAVYGVLEYDLYLGTNETQVTMAATDSPLYIGRLSDSSWQIETALVPGKTYFWRVDPISVGIPMPMEPMSFTVASAAVDKQEITAATVDGFESWTTTIGITSIDGGEPFSFASEQEWISFSEESGTIPSTVTVTLNAKLAGEGFHTGSIAMVAAGGILDIPVRFKVDPLHLTRIVSDRGSPIVYASSEETDTTETPAYLLKIDTATETILDVVTVGSAVSDIMLHTHENRLYATNWIKGRLLAMDPETLEVVETFDFTPTGSGTGDVYLAAAGIAGRIVVEERNRYGNLFDTTTGQYIEGTRVYLGNGAGEADSTGRYYFRGDSNSSGARIRKYDLAGDTFTSLEYVRPDGISYYGSNTVVISEDDSRIFWAYAVLDPTLNTIWFTSEFIYSATADGRYAFGDEGIYDINRRIPILGMPVNTEVSAWNSTTHKLITQDARGLRFDLFEAPFSLGAPVFEDPDPAYDRILLNWKDNSLETHFHLQSREAGSQEWADVDTAIEQNTTSYTVLNLAEDTAYEFRMRAVAPEHSSSWSETTTVRTTFAPPGAPYLNYLSVISPTIIQISFSTFNTEYDAVHIERRRPDENGDWLEIAVIPSSPGLFTHVDEGLTPATRYSYRARLRKGDLFSAYSSTRTTTTPTPQPPAAPDFAYVVPVDSTSLKLCWEPEANTTFYRIEFRERMETDWQFLAEVPHPQNTYLHQGLSEGIVYEYRLFAVNAVGTSPMGSTWEASPKLVHLLVQDSFDPQQDERLWAVFDAQLKPDSFSPGGMFVGTGESAGAIITYELDLSDASHLSFSTIGEWPATMGVYFSIDGNRSYPIDFYQQRETVIPIPESVRTAHTRIIFVIPPTTYPSGIDNFKVHVSGTQWLEGVPYVLGITLNSTTVYLEWPLPEAMRFAFGDNPYDAFQFSIERRLPGRPFEEIAIIESSPSPYYVDQEVPADTAVEYRIVRLAPWAEAEPSIVSSMRTRSQFDEWLEQNVPEAFDDPALAQSPAVQLGYAFGLTLDNVWSQPGFDPQTGAFGVPSISYSDEDASVVLQYPARRQELNPQLEYLLEGSNDFVDWQPLEVPIHDLPIDSVWELVRRPLPIDEFMYYRVRIR